MQKFTKIKITALFTYVCIKNSIYGRIETNSN